MNIQESSPLIVRQQPVRVRGLSEKQYRIATRISHAAQFTLAAIGTGFLLIPCSEGYNTKAIKNTAVVLQIISYIVCGNMAFLFRMGLHNCLRVQRQLDTLIVGNSLQPYKILILTHSNYPKFKKEFIVTEVSTYLLLLASNILFATVLYCKNDEKMLIGAFTPYVNITFATFMQIFRLGQAVY